MPDTVAADSDEGLIKAARGGDDEAFALLVSRYKRKVFLIVSRYTRDEDELDDLCQEIFIKIYHGLGKYRGDAPFEHWLSKLTVNACYDLLRRRQRDSGKVPVETADFVPSAQHDEKRSAEEAWAVLKPALAGLDPEDRLVITLLHLEEKSITEISGLTGWTESKVKVRAFRARKELRRLLEENNAKRP